MSEARIHVAGRGAHGSRCAYCHGDLDGATVQCPSCGVECHVDCRQQVGECPTIGCGPGPAGDEGRSRDAPAHVLRVPGSPHRADEIAGRRPHAPAHAPLFPATPPPATETAGMRAAGESGEAAAALDTRSVRALSRVLGRRSWRAKLCLPLAIAIALAGLYVTFAYPLLNPSFPRRAMSRYDPNWLGLLVFFFGAGWSLLLYALIDAARPAVRLLEALAHEPARQGILRVHADDARRELVAELIDMASGVRSPIDLGTAVVDPRWWLGAGEHFVRVRSRLAWGPFLLESPDGALALVRAPS